MTTEDNTCRCNEGPGERLKIKQEIFDKLRAAAIGAGCSYCVASSSLYLTAVLAYDQLNVDEDEFLRMAKAVYHDVVSQRRPDQIYS